MQKVSRPLGLAKYTAGRDSPVACAQRVRYETRMVSSDAKTISAYIEALPPDRRQAIKAVRAVIRKNLPRGFAETMQYRMIGYSVPLSLHPDTYNGQPICLAALASQKAYMSLYLMSIYADPKLRSWFEKAYKASGKKLDIGKACIRFRSLDDLPLDLVGEAIGKVSVERFIEQYEKGRGSAGRARPKSESGAAASKKRARKRLD